MTTEGRWKTEPPGAEVAEKMRTLLRARLDALDGGDVDTVRDALAEEQWLAELDPVGVPDDVLRETREILGEAEAALRGEPDRRAARDALQRALVIW